MPPPAVDAERVAGAAPLTVTFIACESTHWEFGDGASTDGQTVTHTFAAGIWAVKAAADTSGTYFTIVS